MSKIGSSLGMAFCVALSILMSSCCTRPYQGSGSTWPVAHKYPEGPYQYISWTYAIQTGFCPKRGDLGSKVRVTVMNFREKKTFIDDQFKTGGYFEDVKPVWSKDGSLSIVDTKTKQVIRNYKKTGPDKWALDK